MPASILSSPAPLFVIGLGPGAPDMLTPRARNLLERVSVVSGYRLYLELIPPELLAGKELLHTGMRHEEERCSMALAGALAGKPTALVCSGDPGIYALAGLMLEVLERAGLVGKIPFEIVPGVTALSAAAALLGAPLGHDFACVSLSDLLTPHSLIIRRLEAAFAADFVCVLYNPRSLGRPDHLAQALEFAAKWRDPASCPVGMAQNIGRPGQMLRVSSLAEFKPEWADMVSVIIVGNSETRMAGPYMLTPRGYDKKKGI